MNILASKVKVSPEERKRLRELYHPAFARLSASFACAEAEANMSNNTQTEISDTINELSSSVKMLMNAMDILRNENEYLKNEVVELRNENKKLKANAVKLKTRIIISKRQ